MSDRGDQRNHTRRCCAHHDLFIERPQVFERAAAARDDEEVGPGDRPNRRQAVEAVDRGGHLLGGAFALHPYRPEQDLTRKAAGEPMQNVADHRTGG